MERRSINRRRGGRSGYYRNTEASSAEERATEELIFRIPSVLNISSSSNSSSFNFGGESSSVAVDNNNTTTTSSSSSNSSSAAQHFSFVPTESDLEAPHSTFSASPPFQFFTEPTNPFSFSSPNFGFGENSNNGNSTQQQQPQQPSASPFSLFSHHAPASSSSFSTPPNFATAAAAAAAVSSNASATSNNTSSSSSSGRHVTFSFPPSKFENPFSSNTSSSPSRSVKQTTTNANANNSSSSSATPSALKQAFAQQQQTLRSLKEQLNKANSDKVALEEELNLYKSLKELDNLSIEKLETLISHFAEGSKKLIGVYQDKIRKREQMHALKAEEQSNMCEICCEQKKSHVLNNCGHVFCEKCVKKFDSVCPTCRARFHSSIKFFL